MNNELLPYLSSQERLQAYQLIIDGCSHLWSKGKLQTKKAGEVLMTLIPLTATDPYFLAHLTSYAIKKLQTKDLHVFTTYVNSLSTADGSPFSAGSKYLKPNLRIVSAAAIHQLEPKLVARVLELASMKYFIPPYLREGRHFPNSLRTAIDKYLTYREVNIEIVKGIKKAGLGNVLMKMYRTLHKNPTDEVASILRWQQKDHKITFAETSFQFKDLTDLEIAKKIQDERLPVLSVLGALPRQMSPVIAVALLEQATGNQAVILRKTFEDAGVLKDPEVMKLYTDKIATAKTALDRAETVSQTASQAVKEALSQARSEKRKEETLGIGKIFMHLDFSGSMRGVLQYAMDNAVIFAECVNNPTENFRWGAFQSSGELFPLPTEFVKDAFAQVLFGRRGGGSTNCFALYPNAREFGADVDVFLTDEGNTDGDLTRKIREYHEQHPEVKKPKACVIVNFHGVYAPCYRVKEAYEANGIPVAEMQPETLNESALVAQAVKTALVGPTAIIDTILQTELLQLPSYYYTL